MISSTEGDAGTLERDDWTRGLLDRSPAALFEESLTEAHEELASLRIRPLVEYQHDPIGFMVRELGIPEETIRWGLNPGYEDHRWDGTEEPLVAALEALARWENVAVEAGTGTSKTYVLGAGALLWFLCCWENSWVITAAPKQDQLRLNLWKEVGKLWPRLEERFPRGRMTQLQIRMRGGTDEEWTAFGFVAGVGADEESANRARGMHAEHMLIIFEETPGIHQAITTACENTCTAPHNLRLALGNPDHVADQLHKMVQSPDFRGIRISALDYPNVVINNARDPEGVDLLADPQLIPGAVSRITIQRRADKYLGSAPWIYDAMVRGISPKEASDALIKWIWCEQSAENHMKPAYLDGPRALGVDVANSEAGDKGALAHYTGRCLVEIKAFPCPDALQLGVRVGTIMALERLDPMHVGVDAGGVGSNVVNKLKELGQHCRALHSSARPEPELEGTEDDGTPVVAQEAIFYNLRSQMWWQMRDDLQYQRIALPHDEELWRDLTAPSFQLRNGKILIEPKEDIVERLGRSPDKGDAAVYGNWVRARSSDDLMDDTPISAWDDRVLRREADEGRKVRNHYSTNRPREIEALLS